MYMVGVGRLELPTSASQMPRAADCAIPQNMSTQFFYLAGASKPHNLLCGIIAILRTTFFATTQLYRRARGRLYLLIQ